MQQLDPRDIHKRFGVLHGSIEYFLPDDSGTIRRLTFAASNATGVIVGILTLALLSAITVEIGIIVRSDLQGRGIGRALLAYALEWAGTNRMSRAMAFIDHENHRMRALALAAGFRVVEQDEFCSKMIASIFSREHSGRTSGVVYLS
jgi:acetyltransferase